MQRAARKTGPQSRGSAAGRSYGRRTDDAVAQVGPRRQSWNREAPLRPQRAAAGVRAGAVVLSLFLSILLSDTAAQAWLVPVAITSWASSIQQPGTTRSQIGQVIEAVMASAAILGTGVANSPLLPMLIPPPFAGGLAAGVSGALIPFGLSAFTLLVGGALLPGERDGYLVDAGQWLAVSLAVGLLAAYVRRLVSASEQQSAQDSYRSAYRLLSQLRSVTRKLPGGLDATGIAIDLLESVNRSVPYDRAVLYVQAPGGGRLLPLAHSGGDRPDWDVSPSEDNAFAEAWVTQSPQVRFGPHATTGADPARASAAADGDRQPDDDGRADAAAGGSMVIPLVSGVRSYGLLGVESMSRQYTSQEAREVARLLTDVSLALETAQLFDDVRGVATAEERRRLAREIHDGVAQELVYLGYGLDNALADSQELPSETAPALVGAIEEQLQNLRNQVTRLVDELRLSLFELRSDTTGGLGAALSDHARSVGAASNLTVHLVLDEATNRLPLQVEAELLRIAQEAITNARKHSGARNLWVTCMVDPPTAHLVVEDDGKGMSRSRREGGYGVDIMRERAARVRATVAITARQPNGTKVEVVLGQMSSQPKSDGPVV